MVSREIKFWKTYIKMFPHEREKHIKFISDNLYRLATTKGISEKHKKMMLSQILISYFDDLYNTVDMGDKI